jgi:hypothetical protein
VLPYLPTRDLFPLLTNWGTYRIHVKSSHRKWDSITKK